MKTFFTDIGFLSGENIQYLIQQKVLIKTPEGYGVRDNKIKMDDISIQPYSMFSWVVKDFTDRFSAKSLNSCVDIMRNGVEGDGGSSRVNNVIGYGNSICKSAQDDSDAKSNGRNNKKYKFN